MKACLAAIVQSIVVDWPSICIEACGPCLHCSTRNIDNLNGNMSAYYVESLGLVIGK